MGSYGVAGVEKKGVWAARLTTLPVNQQPKHERRVGSIRILNTEGRLAHCTNHPLCVCPTSYVNFCRLVAWPSSEGYVAKKMRFQSRILLALLVILPCTLARNSTSS